MIFERVGVTWRLLKRLRMILIEVISSVDLGGRRIIKKKK